MPQLLKKDENWNMNRLWLTLLCLLLLLCTLSPSPQCAIGEDMESSYEDASLVILDDPEYFMTDIDEEEPTDWDAYYEAVISQEIDGNGSDADKASQEEAESVSEPETSETESSAAITETLPSTDSYPVITSIGKTNVKIHGVRSTNKLLEYTIPPGLLEADPNFAALMMEAEKYIGYPYVYGASNPKDSFDCSGFVSWVFIHSGVYDTGRRGANGLHSLCSEIAPEDARPGDLIFFQGTMGKDVDGITHVGIYVGNNMMIHAGDPIGFADLTEEKWVKRFYGYGRLPN